MAEQKDGGQQLNVGRALWVFGQIASPVIGVFVGLEHGPGAGLAVGYALLLLVDIRSKK